MRRDLLSSVLAIVAITASCSASATRCWSPASRRSPSPGAPTARRSSATGSSSARGCSRRTSAHDAECYFQSRPSTATSYNPAAATAFTNLGPNSKDARDTFKANLASLSRLERPYDRGLSARGVPVDAVTSSASGVDPHISQANAAIQAHRIASVRDLQLAQVRELIAENTDGRFLGVLGEPGVNVLELNLALDHLTGR